jgi:hypothetical protein
MSQPRKPTDRRVKPSAAASDTKAGAGSRRGLMIAAGVVGVALVAFIVASFSTGGDNESAAGLQETAPVTVTGAALPRLPDTGEDPALGSTLPDMVGQSFDGTPVSITNDGRAKVLLILAHW